MIHVFLFSSQWKAGGFLGVPLSGPSKGSNWCRLQLHALELFASSRPFVANLNGGGTERGAGVAQQSQSDTNHSSGLTVGSDTPQPWSFQPQTSQFPGSAGCTDPGKYPIFLFMVYEQFNSSAWNSPLLLNSDISDASVTHSVITADFSLL